MFQERAGYEGREQVGVGRLDPADRGQALASRNQRSGIHFSDNKEVGNGRPALGHTLGHQPRNGTQRLNLGQGRQARRADSSNNIGCNDRAIRTCAAKRVDINPAFSSKAASFG